MKPLAFILLSLFFLGTSILWLRLDRSPPAWDDGYYLTNSLAMYDALLEGGPRGYAARYLNIMGIKPPLIAVLPTPVYLIAGRKAAAAIAVNMAFLLILFLTLYRLGTLYGSPWAGVIAVCVAGTMPILYGLSRWYLVDLGLATLVCVAIAMIAEWKDSGGVWRAFLLGLTCGLGLLMKVSFPVYLLVPILYFSVREREAFLRAKVALAFAVSAAAVALPWYSFNFRRAWETAIHAGSGETGKIYGTGDIWSLPDIGRYLSNVFHAGPALYFVALPVLLVAFFRIVPPAGRRGLLLCALWGSPILFLALGHYRDLRYAAPLYPALALALGILGDAAIGKRGAAVVTCCLLALPVLSLLQVSFGVLGNSRFELGGLLSAGARLDYARRYNPTPWPHQEILADIQRTGGISGRERKLLIVGTDSARFNADNFALAALEKRMPVQVATTAYETGRNTLLPLLDSASYFLYKEGGDPVSPFNTLAGDAVTEVREGGKFVELPIARKLPDGGVAHVFARIRPVNPVGVTGIEPCNVNFDGRLRLTGLSIERSNDGLQVKYRWRCLKPVLRDYWCFTHIVDRNGTVIGYLDHAIVGGNPPTARWIEGDELSESLLFRLSNAQEEPYRLKLGVFHRESGERLPITGSEFSVTDRGTAAAVSEGLR